ncbi:MAG: hypothetical protein QOF39_2134 [Frankiales bacterium]|jgi:hypothetical protein|nr:hypothetical protein [Frankiales bacterium]
MSDEWLFSYGTLRDPAVQRATFGRELDGRPDGLVGYATKWLEITDTAVVATSGQTHHPMVVRTGVDTDVVDGHVLRLTPAELAAADDYEVDDYRRVRARLTSGTDAWVYVSAHANQS